MDYHNEQRLVKNTQNNTKTFRLYLRVEGQEKYNLAPLLPGRFHVNKLQRGSLLSCYIPRNKVFRGGPVVKNLPANSGDAGLIPGLERFHYCCGATKPMFHSY